MSPDPTERRAFLRDLSFLLGIPFAALLLLLAWWRPWAPWEVPEDTDVFRVIEGTWDWVNADPFCEEDRHTITFSSDHSRMTLTRGSPWVDSTGVEHRSTEYEVLEHSRRHIRGLMRGESRRTASGEPVVWDLVLRSPDEYRWHRTDWPPLGFTEVVRRCPDVAGADPPG